MAEQDIPPPTITAMKIPIIRKGEYDIWSMRMRQYICHTDHNLWDVIVNGDLEEEPAPTTGETSAPPAPKTAKQLAARRNQERVKSILLLAIPDEYLLKFHNVADAKSLWEAIKSRFGGNIESKKMQKNVLKHQFENFSTASNESLDKAYDRFQKLISQLEVHGAPISKEDINQKFLRILPSSWNQITLIMRNKPDIDEIDINDLYNNLRVYEDELKRSSGSNSASQNLAFLSSENTGSTNKVSTTSGDFGISTASGINQVPSTTCAHDIAYSFLAQPTTSPQLKNEDFQQMDGDDLEELDLRWQVAMLTVRVKKSGRSQGRRSYGDNRRSNAPTNESSSQALVDQDGLGGYDWSNDFEVEPVNYALMGISSSSSSSSSDSEYCTKALATLEQTATGKEISNPLIADSLLKTISCEEKTKTKEQSMIRGLNDVYHPIRSILLSRETLLDVKDAFAIIFIEESHRGIAYSFVFVPKPQATSFVSRTKFSNNNNYKNKSDHKTTAVGDLIHLELWGLYKVTNREGFRYFLTMVDDYSRGVWLFPLSILNDVRFYENVFLFKMNTKLSCDSALELSKQDLIDQLNLFYSFDVQTPESPYDEGRDTPSDEGNALNTPNNPRNVSEGHPTDVGFDIPTSTLNTKNIDEQQPVIATRKSNRQTKLPAKFNDYVVNSSKRYGLEKVVKYSHLNSGNFVSLLF
ncbi:hypothetical protein Tco_0633423 [Tanacetum coccineum]